MGGSRAQGACSRPRRLHSVLSYKRLDRRTFRVPDPPLADMTSIELGERELDDLLDGIDVEVAPVLPRGRRRLH